MSIHAISNSEPSAYEVSTSLTLTCISPKKSRKCGSDIDSDWKNGRENIIRIDEASGHLFLANSIDATDYQQIFEKYELACYKRARSPSPLTDKPLWSLFRLFVIFTNFTLARKKSSQKLLIQSDLNALPLLQKRATSRTKTIISLYWAAIDAHPNGKKLHQAISLTWKKSLLSQMNYISDFFATINVSSKWSEIPNKIRFFSDHIHKNIQALIAKNLKLPASLASIDTKKNLYTYALFQAQEHSFHLTNAYLRKGIDSAMTFLISLGYSFTASTLVPYKPRVTKEEEAIRKKLMSQ